MVCQSMPFRQEPVLFIDSLPAARTAIPSLAILLVNHHPLHRTILDAMYAIVMDRFGQCAATRTFSRASFQLYMKDQTIRNVLDLFHIHLFHSQRICGIFLIEHISFLADVC